MYCDSFVHCFKTQILLIELKISDDKFDFTSSDPYQEIFSTKSKQVIGKLKTEPPVAKEIDDYLLPYGVKFMHVKNEKIRRKVEVRTNQVI